jgi:hypothetical protein
MKKKLTKKIKDVLIALQSNNRAQAGLIDNSILDILYAHRLILKSNRRLTLNGLKAIKNGFFDEVLPDHRGGSRSSAGRKTEKTAEDQPLIKVTLLLDQYAIQQFKEAGNGNASFGARRIAKSIVLTH